MENVRIGVGPYCQYGAAADVVRRAVFLEEQGVPEDEVFDGKNEQAAHVVLWVDETPAATVRMYKKPECWSIGLVAVVRERRGTHLGEKAMRAAIDYIAAQGGREIELSAQEHACGFYEKLGFKPCGEIVRFESGFVLVPMRCTLG